MVEVYFIGGLVDRSRQMFNEPIPPVLKFAEPMRVNPQLPLDDEEPTSKVGFRIHFYTRIGRVKTHTIGVEHPIEVYALDWIEDAE